MKNKEGKKVKEILERVRDMQLAKAPENAYKMYPGGIPTHSGSCPICGKQSNALSKYVQDKTVYQGISFCPRCGQALDWTGIISMEELEELNDE